MRSFLEKVSTEPVPQPYLYPLPEGGITAEWSFEPWEASAEIDANGICVVLHAVNTESMQVLDQSYELESADLMVAFQSFMSSILPSKVRNAN